ncbi:unnamed protein product [Symbiodinium natans]|uniref:Peptidase A2 domain-containing protein n=1 Tax=Symbiodinium natans TaxID=878477 RepID=A0A812LGU1_9DINO|nr:unnamed protein product [Symbiodinium natans]
MENLPLAPETWQPRATVPYTAPRHAGLAAPLQLDGLASQAALCTGAYLLGRGRRSAKTRHRSIGGSAGGAIAVAERSVAERLLEMSARDLRRELQLRGLNTDTSPDKQMLLELGTASGVLPHSAGRRRRRLAAQVDEPPIIVALQRVRPHHDDLVPSGAFTDGERLALPLWSKTMPLERPRWFVLDTSLKRSAVAASYAKSLGVAPDGGPVQCLHFANEPVGELDVQVVPDGSVVLGSSTQDIAGLLGMDFFHRFDVDLDLPRGIGRAWPSGSSLPRGFGLTDAVEIELKGDRGLLEVDAHLRGTVCSGTDLRSEPLRALVDLGQTYSACNWIAAKQVQISGGADPCIRRAGEWLGLDGRPVEVHEADMGVELPGRVGGVLQGERLCSSRLFWLAETLPILERLGFDSSQPLAVLGLDTVGRVRLAISAKHRRLWLPM